MLDVTTKPDLGLFDWSDPFRLEDQLTDDERMMGEAARAYAEDKLQPRVIAAYREESVYPSIFAEMGQLGLLGVTIPEAYGGVGAGYVSYGVVARAIDGDGVPQPEGPAPVAPNGAEGYHRVRIRVDSPSA